MAITVGTTSNTTPLALSTSPISLPNSYTTKANDVAVIIIGTPSADWTGVTVSGLGASWIIKSLPATSGNNGNWFAIGYGCSAGNTTFTLSSNPASGTAVGVGIFSGASSAAPTQLFGPLSNTNNFSTVTGTNLSWSAGQLLIAFGQAYQWNNLTPSGTWAGTSDTFAARNGTTRMVFLDYLIAPSSQTNQSYVSPQSASAYPIGSVYGFAIKPASNGNMFLAMGF